MSTPTSRVAAVTAAICVTGLIVAGCGGSDDSSSADSAKASVDSAVTSCQDAAKDVGGQVGSILESACGQVGNTFSQDLSDSGDDVEAARADAVDSCRQSADSVPAGEARDALSSLCDEIANVGDGG